MLNPTLQACIPEPLEPSPGYATDNVHNISQLFGKKCNALTCHNKVKFGQVSKKTNNSVVQATKLYHLDSLSVTVVIFDMNS